MQLLFAFWVQHRTRNVWEKASRLTLPRLPTRSSCQEAERHIAGESLTTQATEPFNLGGHKILISGLPGGRDENVLMAH